ncbi:hypothetical protein [Sphingomonas sp. DT-204]|uniref:hypothetical protein n=1 Tax=Sphingomonas sp. DT-204 TaxID=3396166 RepID=UPI003F1B2A1D
MINPINGGRADAVSLRGIDGKRSGGTQAATAMNTISTRIAETMTRELKLAPVDPRGGYAGGSANDAYGVEEIAAELSQSLGGSPADQGRLSRALHAFAETVATLIAARPLSSTVSNLTSSLGVDLNGDKPTTEEALAMIEATTVRLRPDGYS